MIKLAKIFLFISAILITVLIVFLVVHNFRDKHYFKFNEIVYYHTDLSEQDIFNIKQKKEITPLEKLLVHTTFNEHSGNIKDTLFVSHLEDAGFVSKDISKAKFSLLQEIFKFKEHVSDETSACEPLYRDILIFKQNGSVVGIAKLCFRCGQHDIVGTNENTACFGESGDFKRLEEVLFK